MFIENRAGHLVKRLRKLEQFETVPGKVFSKENKVMDVNKKNRERERNDKIIFTIQVCL